MFLNTTKKRNLYIEGQTAC